jgi:hypothetical protein
MHNTQHCSHVRRRQSSRPEGIHWKHELMQGTERDAQFDNIVRGQHQATWACCITAGREQQ